MFVFVFVFVVVLIFYLIIYIHVEYLSPLSYLFSLNVDSLIYIYFQTAGTKYTIEVHHTEGAGDAAIHLRWSHACEAKKVLYNIISISCLA